MKRYRLVKKHKTQLSEEEIIKLKSFTNLTQSYQRATRRPTVPLYKNKWAFIALLIIILLTLLLSGEWE
jgi:AAA15 family ATPase/GTPase